MLNITFGCIDNRRSFIARHNPVIWDELLYDAITFKLLKGNPLHGETMDILSRGTALCSCQPNQIMDKEHLI